MNMNFDPTPAQTLAMTSCMLAISHVDGVQPAETALIGKFYEGGRVGDMPAFETLHGSHAEAAKLLEELVQKRSEDGVEFGDALVTLCLMTGYADGTLTDAERAQVQAFGQMAGVTPERFEAQLQMVRDSLLGSLSGLPDSASVAALAKEL